tara:strand:- start:442 stop:552 length:111 start_codon:yes stop_codon:yes gene_type:complete
MGRACIDRLRAVWRRLLFTLAQEMTQNDHGCGVLEI